MNDPSSPALPSSTCRYFVDEAGDGVLFDTKGRALIEREGFPKHFILGMVELADESAVSADLASLRARLLADPYFKGVPSMQPGERKTALHFHAKDDLSEVRREVFQVLLRHEFKFFAVIKSMSAVLEYVRRRNLMDGAYRYTPNELYDLTVRLLFNQRLHQHARYEVVFARRGKGDRTEALKGQLLATRRRFMEKMASPSDAEVVATPAFPHERPGLQVADYCLWALQRLYERGEDRFIQMMWPKVSLLRDVDDKQNSLHGWYYTRTSPALTADKMKERRV